MPLINIPLAQQNLFKLLGARGAESLITRIWQEFTGRDVRIGIFDTAIETSHSDLNQNFGTQSTPAQPTTASHGTMVAGVIGASDNATGTIGIAHGASLSSTNIFALPGFSTQGPNFLAAITASGKFDVVNHSWGNMALFDANQNLNNNSSFATSLVSAYKHIAATGRNGLGTNIVQAAGNENIDANGDGVNASRFTITVGALKEDGTITNSSNQGANLLVSAAGENLATTIQNNGYGTFGGTSAATAVTTSVIGLMLDANPYLGWRDVQEILAQSAYQTGPVAAPTWVYNKATNWNGGGMHFSNDYGFGAVNVYAAVRMAEVWSQFTTPQTSRNEIAITSNAIAANLNIADLATSTFKFNMAQNITLEHVDLTLRLNHSSFTDLQIYLVSPFGTKVQMYDGSNGDESTADQGLTWTFGAEAFRGETSLGTWTVMIVDRFARDQGVLNTVELSGFGQSIKAHDVYTFTDEFFRLSSTQTARKILIDSDGGVDWINAAAVTGNIVVDLTAGKTATSDGQSFFTINSRTNIENIITGDGNDIISGNTSNNQIFGMRGNDVIEGRAGSDRLDGGDGIDTLSYATSRLGVSVNLSTSSVSGGDAQGDTIFNFENVLGSNSVDRLTGNAGNNTLVGNNGNDVLAGGAGNDILSGGAGSDTFFFNTANFGQDVITDWIDGFDRIDLTGSGLSLANFSLAQVGADTVLANFANPENTILLSNVKVGLINGLDFI